jgi:hypothetical protein
VDDSRIVDSRMVAPPAVSRAKVRTLLSGKGKGTAKAGSAAESVAHALEEASLSVPEGICAKSGVYTLLCFCCPMPDTETYRRRYVLEEGTDDLRTSMGKSIIDLHTEFAARKAVKEKAIRAGQAGHAHVFHQEEELAAIIAQCEHRKTDSLHYGPPVDADSAWLRNMPMEEDTNVVAEADAATSEWKKITADARPPPGSTLYTVTNPGGRLTNLGWVASNRFEAIDESHTEATPSKVADNA